MRPPTLASKSLRLNGGLGFEGRVLEKLLAFKTLFLKISVASPWNALAPDLMVDSMTAPVPAMLSFHGSGHHAKLAQRVGEMTFTASGMLMARSLALGPVQNEVVGVAER